MGEFFRGWRRKVGVVTLVMACLFMGGWVRSSGWSDSFSFPCGLHADASMISSDGMLIIYRRILDDPLGSFVPSISTNPGTHSASHFLHLENIGLEWCWETLGFRIGRTEYLSRFKMEFLFAVVPYWSITIPPTLLSFWLLLSKPRKSIQKASVEPIPEKVA